MSAATDLQQLVAVQADSCVEWVRAKQTNGYGLLRYAGKYMLAHRAAWLIHTGTEPHGVVLHSCDNPACVNPRHLSVGTQQDNLADMRRKGRGGSPPKALTDEQVQYILANYQRYKHGCSGPALARQLGVSAKLVTETVRNHKGDPHV